MNKKIAIFTSMFAAILLLPLGVVFAAKPVEMSATLTCEAEIIESRVAGNNLFNLHVEMVGIFTGGDIVGNIQREAKAHANLLSNSANGPVIPPLVVTGHQVWYVTDAEVTIGDDVAVGSFVIKADGKVGNVIWRIVSSDVTVDSEPVTLHGNGKLIQNNRITTGPTTYILENTLTGQISFS
jgi:hypothetical protein